MKQGVFLTSFAITLLALLGLARVYTLHSRSVAAKHLGLTPSAELSQESLALSRLLSLEKHLAPEVVSAEAAKRKKLFWPSYEVAGSPPWATDRRGFGMDIGFGVKVLENPELRDSVFPGYGALLPPSHSPFWDQYFSRSFNARIWVPDLAPAGYALNLPWSGCMDIYREFGADLIILGTSETYRGIIPARLQKLTAEKSRVLQCARGGMYIDETLALVKAMNATPQAKIQWAVWGLSSWNLESEQLNFGGHRDRKEETEKELRINSKNILEEKVSDYFAGLSWKTFFPESFSEIKRSLQDPNHQYWVKEEENYWWHSDRFVFLPKQASSAKLREIAHKFAPAPNELTQNCKLNKRVIERFEETLAQLNARAEKVLLYIPPVSDLFEWRIPNCFRAEVHKLYKSHESDKVIVLLDNWKSYGLDYEHYVYPSRYDHRDYLNGNHVNYLGAELVTDRLAAEIRKHQTGFQKPL